MKVLLFVGETMLREGGSAGEGREGRRVGKGGEIGKVCFGEGVEHWGSCERIKS